MKYNTTYTPTTNLKETLINIEKIRNYIVSFYSKKFEITKVSAPLHDLDSSEKLVNYSVITRHITFDFSNEYRVGKLFLSHTHWLHDLIIRTQLKSNEGYLIDANYLWRDIEENSSISAENEEITIQVNLDNKVDIYEFVQKEMINLYEEIIKWFKNINSKSINEVFLINDINIFSSQDLDNMMPELYPKEREERIIQDYDYFILKNPGKKLLSGKRHRYVPPTLYNLNNHYQLFIKDRINSSPLVVASVSEIISGPELFDQLRVYKETQFLESDFYNNITKNNRKIVEFKINVPKLAMIILNKGHIGEVQPGTTIKEVEHIKERYKVEII